MSATKKRRIDDGPEDRKPTPIIRSEIWYKDGNIILEAEGTQFRVHRSLLAKHSSVFKDVFDVLDASPPPDEHTVEGCSIVRLAETARDVGHLLNGLYDWFYRSSDALPISILFAMARLGHRYAFLRFRDDAVSRLEYEFPPDLASYLERKSYTRIEPEESIEQLDILILALELKLHRVLPSLYLDIIGRGKYDLKQIFEGVPRKDGSLIQLSQEAKYTWALGSSRLQEASMKYTLHWLTRVPYKSCTAKNRCFGTAQSIHFMLFAKASYDAVVPGLVDWNASWTERFCDCCRPVARRAHEEGRFKFWEALPSFFGLSPWSNLSNFD